MTSYLDFVVQVRLYWQIEITQLFSFKPTLLNKAQFAVANILTLV
jgi:hypothetical protein